MRISLIVLAAAAAAVVVAGGSVAGNTPDTDGDGVFNLVDNCGERSNSLATAGHLILQCDDDADGFGNTCDGDFNQNGIVNAQDSAIYNQCFACAAGQSGSTVGCVASGGIACAVTDINCNGLQNAQDTSAFNVLFVGNVVGPSGLPCARKDISAPNMTGRHPCLYDPNGSAD